MIMRPLDNTLTIAKIEQTHMPSLSESDGREIDGAMISSQRPYGLALTGAESTWVMLISSLVSNSERVKLTSLNGQRIDVHRRRILPSQCTLRKRQSRSKTTMGELKIRPQRGKL